MKVDATRLFKALRAAFFPPTSSAMNAPLCTLLVLVALATSVAAFVGMTVALAQ